MNDILNKLNGFHQNIQFTNELEKNNKLAFLDVLLNRNRYVFEKFNNYPKWVIKQLLEKVKYNHHETSHIVWQINEINNDEKSHLLLLPY